MPLQKAVSVCECKFEMIAGVEPAARTSSVSFPSSSTIESAPRNDVP